MSATDAGSSDAGSRDAGMESYNPCPTDGNACKILPLGDSITFGIQLPGAYRIELFRQAVLAEQNITFVGSQMNGPDIVQGAPFPKNHEGYSGFTIDQIDQQIVTNALQTKPDIVTLMIGTNDIYGNDPANAPARLEALIDKIFDMDSHALLVIAKLTPLPNFQSTVDTYNQALPAIVEERAAASKHIALVDMSDTTISSDSVHPNEAGYTHMGQVWYEAIGKLLPQKN
jgi:lysophospholipase L1-like esterase